jgi:beta-xylosidase
MKTHLSAILLFFLIGGCTPTPSIPPEVFFTRTPTATTEPTPLTTETETPIPTPGEIYTAAPEPYFRDDFDGELKPGWEWINEDEFNWSLSTEPGMLHIEVAEGYVQQNNASNVLMRPAPNGDFQIETKLTFEPWGIDQFAGLIIFESNFNFIQGGYAFCLSFSGCKENGLYMDIIQNGSLVLPLKPTPFEDDTVYLRLSRRGNSVSFLASFDGISWYRQDTYTTEINPVMIGIATGRNIYEETVSAYFDYFQVDILE